MCKLMIGDDDMLIDLGDGVDIIEHSSEDGAFSYLEEWFGEVLGEFTKTCGITCRYYYILHKDLIVDKSGSVVRLYPKYFECVFVFRKFGKVGIPDGLFDGFFMLGIDKGYDGTLESCSGEATAIDALETSHGLVDGNEFGTATFVVVDGGFA